jgi:sulfatase maturation enzyme AslB (radical SAM superfamily)
LDFAYKVGYQTVFLNTNGVLLTADIAGRLADYGDISISVSLEGTEALHERLRGEGSYRQTLRGIETALKAGIVLSIFTMACKSLLPELLHFADDVYRRFPNIAELTLIQLIPVAGGTPALSQELLEPEDFLKLVKTVSLLNLLGHRTRFLNNPLANVASKLQKILWIPRSRPLYSEGRLMVMANRDICLSHSSRYPFGKYEPGNISKVLNSDGYRQAVTPDEKTCPECKYTALCMKYGMARPTENYWEVISDVHFCQNVLDSAENLLHV